MIAEHDVAEAELSVGNSAEEEPVRQHGDPLVSFRAHAIRWRASLAYGLARLHGCAAVEKRVYFSAAPSALCIEVFGRPTDVATVRYLFAWLDAEIVRLVSAHGRGRGRSWRTSYCIGAVRGVLEAMRGANEVARQHASSTALAVLDSRLAASLAARAVIYPELRQVGGGSVSDADAFHRGKSDGSRLAEVSKLPMHQRSALPTSVGPRALKAAGR